MKNIEKYVKEIAHDILCASSESGSDVEMVMPNNLINGFPDFNESYDSDTLKKVVDWLLKETDSSDDSRPLRVQFKSFQDGLVGKKQ